jgi:hypothetical protein
VASEGLTTAAKYRASEKNSTEVCTAQFQDQAEHRQQLRRCLTDDTLPLEVRVAGTLIRLYGLPLAHLVELTTDRHRLPTSQQPPI